MFPGDEITGVVGLGCTGWVGQASRRDQQTEHEMKSCEPCTEEMVEVVRVMRTHSLVPNFDSRLYIVVLRHTYAALAMATAWKSLRALLDCPTSLVGLQ